MLRRIKYRLLRWLLDDMCIRMGPLCSDCKKCPMSYETRVDDLIGPACLQNDIFVMARKVWGLEE